MYLYMKMELNHICDYENQYVYDVRINGVVSGILILNKVHLSKISFLF